MASQAELADLVGLSVTMVKRHLADLGIRRAADGYSETEFVRAYCKRLREQAAGRADASGGGALATERARLASEQADAVARKNAVERGDLVPVAEVTKVMIDANSRVRAKLIALPSRAAPLVAAMTKPIEVREKLTELVHEALAELAATQTESDGKD